LVDSVLVSEGQIDLFASNAGTPWDSIEMDASAAEADWQRIVAINQKTHQSKLLILNA
jgi:hypothetical protein